MRAMSLLTRSAGVLGLRHNPAIPGVSRRRLGALTDIFHSDKVEQEAGMSAADGMGYRTSITAYGENSFVVNNVYVTQPVLLLPNSFLLWEKVNSVKEITVDSLRVFSALSPSVEILFLGVGESVTLATLRDPTLQAVKEYFRAKGVLVEVLSTVNAATTFNVLNIEGRNVGAALLTMLPLPASVDNSDVLNM